MKKLLFILTAMFITFSVFAQQTEDEVYVGKGKTFGNYKGTAIIIPDVGKNSKPTDVPRSITGVVIDNGPADSLTNGGLRSIKLKKDDGTIITVGTKDYGFTVPRNLVGRRITIEGDMVAGGRKRRDYQKDIQFAATGIIVID